MPSPSQQPAVRFGAFEIDFHAKELRKHGILIKLHEKPLQVLLALIEKHGGVVTRKELQDRLWPGDTFVEAENGLNNAISRLREALGDTAASPRFIGTIPRHGYRFLAEVSSEGSPATRTGSLKFWLTGIGLIAAILLVLAVALRFESKRPMAIRSLAVLPFRNLGGNSADDYFADGMTDAVTTQLAEIGGPKVTSETSVEQFKDTKETVPKIARALGVDAIVEGAVLQEGNQVRITVQLISAQTDRHIWAESYQRSLKDILELQHEIALGVARGIELKLSPDAAGRSAPSGPVNPEAYDDYLKGRYMLKKGSEVASFERAKSYFEEAIRLDPQYAPSYAGLSAYYILDDSLSPKEAFPKAEDFAKKALQLEPNLPDAHSSLAYVYFYGDWNWPAAEQEFETAISLDPSFALAHSWYSMYLAAMGREKDALAEAQRAELLDPVSIGSHDYAATVAIWIRRYGLSIEEGHKIVELDADDPRGYEHLAVGHFQKGMYQDALREAEQGLSISHRDPTFLFLTAFVYGRLGKMQQATKLLEEMRADSRTKYVSPYFFASALAGMGNDKEAIDALEQGYSLHDPYMVFLRSSPWFDPLRSDPRFQGLIKRMQFPPVTVVPQS